MFKKLNRLMAAVVAILASGFLATSLTSYFVSRASLRAEITQSSLPLTSDNIYSEIQRDLLQPVFISSLMAHDTFVRDWVLQGEQNETEIVRYLKELKNKYGTITSFFVSDRTGKYYYAEGTLKNIDPAEKRDAWYFRVKGIQDDYEINIDPDLANQDTMTIFINYKVFDYDDNFIGATGVGLTVNAVKTLINHYQEKYRRNIFFVDPEGTITLRSAAFKAEGDSILEIEGIGDHAKDILWSPGASYSYVRNGQNYYLHTRYIKEFNWYLLVEENEERATRELLRTLIFNILISLAITCIIFLLLRRQILAYQNKIETLAATDKLTGLFNRQAFDVIMDMALKEKKRANRDMALVMLDLDHFKKVNDTWGHLCGDQVLVQSAERIKSVLRAADALCRWGGEEFFVLMKECGTEDALRTAEKIRKSFETVPFMVDGNAIALTASLGLTLLSNEDTAQKAVARADKALYAAKAAGRNRTEIG